MHDLYPVLVDQIARDCLRADRVRLAPSKAGRANAIDHLLEGLTAPDSALPRHSGLAALERRLSDWVDAGLGTLTRTVWRLGLHLDERLTADPDEEPRLVLELWLQASDDPTLGLPASLLWDRDDDVFAFLRAGDPRRDLIRHLTELEPLLAEIGIEFDAAEPSEAELGAGAGAALPPRGDAEARGARRAGAAARVLAALAGPRPGQPDGDERAALRARAACSRRRSWRSFDWRLAVGDTVLTDQELADLAAAKEPFVRVGEPLARGPPLGRREGAALPRPAPRRRRASSTSSARSPGSRRTRPASSSARSRSTSRSPPSSTPASAASARCRRRRR